MSSLNEYGIIPECDIARADELARQRAEIESLKAQRNALRAELRAATEAMDDPAVNNLRTLPEAIRMLRAERDALRADADAAIKALEGWKDE